MAALASLGIFYVGMALCWKLGLLDLVWETYLSASHPILHTLSPPNGGVAILITLVHQPVAIHRTMPIAYLSPTPTLTCHVSGPLVVPVSL